MTFQELGVIDPILKAVDELGFVHPMPIQEAVIAPLLSPEGENMIALAQTGTGKTAAFGIPVLQKIDTESLETQALIVSPTRELCLQIADDLNDFAKYLPGIHVAAVYGGTGMEQQMRMLKRGVQIIVATPGRLIDLKNRGYARLENVKTVVLDEADEMLNMGFQDSITEIFESVSPDVRKLLFSATMSREVEQVAKGYLGNYKEIIVGSRNEGAENVNHIYYMVHAKDKYLALKRIVDFYPKIYAIIFCRTKLETQDVADKLIRDGYNAESLHGDLSQPQRDQTMQKFRQHTVQLLVATDVAARGLDVDDLTHVINYGMPDDIESYTHRSGRTGRAGKNGTSISIIHTKEKFKVKNIEKVIGKQFVDGDLPTPQEICTKQLYKAMDEIMKMDVDEQQIEPFMAEINRHFEYVEKEDVIKKIVSMTFGRFLSYYADAPEIEKPARREVKNVERERKAKAQKGPREVEDGYSRLFINLGKDNGFYPGECMQFMNKVLGGKQKVGHIDLYGKFAYIEIPEEDAEHVMASLDGTFYHGIPVRCNPADAVPESTSNSSSSQRRLLPTGKMQRRNESEKDYSRLPKKKEERRGKREEISERRGRSGADARKAAFGFAPAEKKPRRGAGRNSVQYEVPDWRQFFDHSDNIVSGNETKKKGKGRGKDKFLRGTEPDFTEEGWARRKPKK